LNAPLHIDPAAIARAFVSKRVPRSEQWRTHFGRSLTPARIDSAIRDAADGFMTDLTDAGAESILIDPHLASVLQKRFGSISQVDWDITPSQADGIDKQKALEIANVVRSQIAQIPAFRQALHDLAWGHWNGRAALEIHWDRRFTGRAQYQVAELSWIHPRRLTFGPERELRVIDPSWSVGQFQPVGLDTRVACKFIKFVPRLFDEYPERDGLNPRCLYWSNFKRFCARDRMILIELFAKPWRVLEEDSQATVSPDQVDEAIDYADALGGATVAKMPKGIKLNVVELDPKSGDLHNHTIEDCDKQTSKIVLGNTNTTDSQSGGLGSGQAFVHQDEQQLIFQADGDRIGGVLQRDLVLAIVTLNAGSFGISAFDACRYAPKFTLRTAPERDLERELRCYKMLLDLGLAAAADEVRERTGYRKPEEGEATIQVVESPQDDMSARYIPPRPMLVDPSGTEPGIGEYGGAGAQPPPAPKKPDGSTSAPANDTAPAAAAATLEPGTPDEDFELFQGPLGVALAELTDLAATEAADGLTNFPVLGENARVSLKNSRFRVFPLSVARQLREEYPQIWSKGTALGKLQFRKLAPIVDRRGVVETDAEDEAVRLREAWAAKHVNDGDVAGVVSQIQWLVIGAQGYDRMLRTIGVEKARIREVPAGREVAPVADVAASADSSPLLLDKQPGYINGSVEDISDARTRRGAAITTRWASALARSVDGHTTAARIRLALRAAAKALDVRSLASEIERCMLHSAALGVLDADWEANNEEPIAPATFAVQLAGGQRGFTTTPFWEAINAFLSREVVERSVWDRLTGSAKKKSFSIAGLARKSMLDVAFDELGKSITQGKSLANFRKALNARFDEAGWKKLKPSHVETVFRNATMGAYSSGREVQMTQPAVLKARPYWQIRVVKDDRCRATHAKVRGFVLRADDPFWKRVGRPPWGHQCFLPGTIISGAVVGASRALYTGKAIEIVTHKGRRLSVTANHPVLTADGFASAQSIRVGDDLVCYKVESGIGTLGLGTQGDEHHEPAEAEKVFGALSELVETGRIRCVSSDFHGEAERFAGDVDVVGSYWKLPSDDESAFAEKRDEFVLEQSTNATHGESNRRTLALGSDSTSSGPPSSAALPLDRSAVDLQSGPLVTLRFGLISQRDSSLAQCVADNLSGDAKLVGQLLERGAGSVSLDKVIEVREFDWSGHVYDFQSETGWVVADGIVASNCRCTVVSRSEREINRLGLSVRRGSEISGLPDPGWSSSKSDLL
jgi:phage gp29-like protein